MTTSQPIVEQALVQAIVEGAQLWVVVYEHRYGTDTWVRLARERPDADAEALALDNYEPKHDESVHVHGPFDITDPELRELPMPVVRKYRNFYDHCGEKWEDEADSACNDRCPHCNAEIEPYDSTPQ
jgi:hypothetical protein